MTVDLILFFILALISVISAVSMLLSRNAVYSALFLIINFGTIAAFYLMLGAPFLAMAQVTVYAGAIMVLFLFVIMLLGAEQLRLSQSISWQQPLAIILGAVLLIEAGVILFSTQSTAALLPPFSTLNSEAAGPTAIGTALFNQYLLPFEITSVLLLVAMIGAIVLSKTEKRAG
jgi:NADH-quinone oxidoreductase subunit J